MKMFSIAFALITTLLSDYIHAADYADKYALLVQQHQMIERQQSHFDYVLERSHDKSAGVQKVYLAGLSLDQLEIEDSYKTHRLLREEFALSEKDKAGLRALFAQVMSEHFDESADFELVSNAGHADVVIVADILQMSPSAPKDDFRSREIGIKYYTAGSGDVTVVFDVYKKGQLVMKIEDTRDAGRIWQRNTKLSNKQNTRLLMRVWAKQLSQLI